MQLNINGERQDLPGAATAADLIRLLGLAGQRVALEVNEEIVPRSRYPDLRLQEGDRVEIVRAIGGG